MSKLTNYVSKKSLIGIMFGAVLAVGFAFATPASADCSIMTNLRIGSKGIEVSCLQTKLGVSADGSFGPLTEKSVKSWQASHGLKADGIVGPMTRGALNNVVSVNNSYPAGCTSSSGYSTTTGWPCSGNSNLPAGCMAGYIYSSTTGVKCDGSSSNSTNNPPAGSLGSGNGDITNVKEISSKDSSAEEGTNNEIFAFKFDVEGDVKINRFDLYLDSELAGLESEDADDYFESAILMADGKKVAELKVKDWSEDSYNKVDVVSGDGDEYRLRFSNLSLVYHNNDNPKFALVLKTNKTIDSGDQSETWGVELAADSIRFSDGKGFSSQAGAVLKESFGIDSQKTAELTVRSSSKDLDAAAIEVSKNSTTKKVPVFVFEIQERNGINVKVNDLNVTITTGAVSGTTNESVVVQDAFLYKGSNLLGSESVPNGGVVSFENLGLEIGANKSVELTLKLTFSDADEFDAGTDISATISGATDITDAEDANGNDEGDMVLGGSATSENHELRSEGIMVKFIDSSYTKTSSNTLNVDETVEFTLRFDVTAFGDDIWVENSCTDNASPLSSYTTDVVVSLDGDLDGDNTTCTNIDSTGKEGVYGFRVAEGKTEHFTVNILGNGNEAGNPGDPVTFRARLESIGYKVGTDAPGDMQYAFNLADFKSSAVTVFDR